MVAPGSIHPNTNTGQRQQGGGARGRSSSRRQDGPLVDRKPRSRSSSATSTRLRAVGSRMAARDPSSSGSSVGSSTTNEHVEEAGRLKGYGNSAFMAKPPRVREAAEEYSRAIGELDESGADNEAGPLDLRCTLLQNRAACRLQLKDYKGCLEDCNEVMAFDKARHKARYRRGLAYEGLGLYDNALRDLKAVYAVDASGPVEDAVDRVEIRQDLAGLKCAWTPNNLSLTFDLIWSADGSRPACHPSDRDKDIMRETVSHALTKCVQAVERRRKRPSATVMKLLGIYSGDEEVDFARAQCISLAYHAAPMSRMNMLGVWFQAIGEDDWTETVLDWEPVKHTPWARIVRQRGGLPGRRNSRIPGQPDVKEVLPPAPAPPTHQRSISSGSGGSSGSSGSGGSRSSVIGREEDVVRGMKRGR